MKHDCRIYSLLFLIVMAGCVKEGFDNKNLKTIRTVAADLTELPDTKAHLTGGTRIVWDAVDAIQVYSDIQDPELYTNVAEQSGEASNMFSGNAVSGTEFFAFNSDSGLQFSQDDRYILKTYLPSPCVGTDPHLALPMVAKLENGVFKFKQTVGLLHFAFKGNQTIRGVWLYGNNSEAIEGTGTINIKDDKPCFQLGEGALQGAGIFFENPYNISAGESLDLFFPMAPTLFSAGITLEIYYVEDSIEKSITKKTEKELNISRAEVHSFTIVDLDEMIEGRKSELALEHQALIDFYESTGGPDWENNTNWCSEKPINEWYGVSCDNIGHVTDLILSYNNLSGQIPESIGNLTKLTQLALNNNSLSGPVPSSIGHLKSLFNLVLSSNHLSGELPDSLSELTELKQLFLNDNWFSGDLPDITKMLQLKYFDVSNSSIGAGGGEVALDSTKVHYNQFTGHIPDAIGNLTQLEWYTIGVNRVSGTIPESIWSLPNLTALELDNNPITGSISPAVANAKKLEYLYLSNCELSGDIPEEIGELTNLEQLLFGNADAVAGIDHTYASNSLSGTLPQSIGNLTQLKSLDVYNNDLTGTLPESMATMESLTGFLAFGNRFNGQISKNVMSNPNFPDWQLDPQQQGYGFSYELDSSEDYSKDGAVSVLQKANTGNGINIVLMGDAFIDDDIASGYYDKTMQKAYTALFNVEPFHSFQDYFNVYQVTVVSPNNSYLNGATRALKTEFGSGTVVYGDNEACTGYASKAVGEENMDETLVVVILNSDRYAGTCYMYSPSSGDFGNGYSIAYVPMGTDEEMFNALIHHEANGHGFAKLEDEYAYEYNNTIPDDIKESKRSTEVYGWWPNIDFISDPTAVKWAKYIADSRYVNEGIGVFEGGASYWSGVWRPTEESIMNHNYGTFNAPSREAIYKRIHKLAFGDSWSFDYEEFVKYDKINLTASTKAQGRGVERSYKPLAPPVVCKGPIPLKKQEPAHGQEPKEVVFKIVNGRRVIQL